MSATEEQKTSEEIILEEFFKVIFKSKSFKGLLEKYFERIDEYTDRRSGGLPDFYLRSKADRIPDLAIEIKTLQRDYDRFADYKKLFEIKEYKLMIRDLEFVINLNPPGYAFPSPRKVVKLWGEFENDLKEFERRLEYIVDEINTLEKKLEDKNQDMYLKDLSHEQKEELIKVICDIKQKDEEFVKYTDFIYTLSYFEIHLGVDRNVSRVDVSDVDKIGNIREIIKRDKKRFLNQYVKYFLKNYFKDYLNEKACKSSSSDCIVSVSSKEQENQFVFTVYPVIKMWKSEDINFHVEKIVEFIEESKRKFEKLRKEKFDKSDKNPHLELLLVKVTSFANETFERHVKELYEELMQRGYNYPFYPIKGLDSLLNLSEFFIDPSNSSVLSKFYLICMNKY